MNNCPKTFLQAAEKMLTCDRHYDLISKSGVIGLHDMKITSEDMWYKIQREYNFINPFSYVYVGNEISCWFLLFIAASEGELDT